MADEAKNPEKREQTPRKAELPSSTPDSTRRILEKLEEMAGPASRERVASRLGVQLKGRLVSGLHAAQLYGFIEVDGDDKLVLTARGVAYLGDDSEAAKSAEQQAVMATGFGAVVKKLMTHKADPEIVAIRLQEDQGLAVGPATERAKVLVKAAKAAGLVSDDKFDAGAIEDAIAVVGEPAEPAPEALSTTAKAKTGTTSQSKPATPGKPAATTGAAKGEDGNQEKPDVPFEALVPPLQVVLHIDASKLGAEEIGAIVRELRATVTVSTTAS